MRRTFEADGITELPRDQWEKIDPCDDYTDHGYMCPHDAAHNFDVSFGQRGHRDIIPIRTLLRAAGVEDKASPHFGLDRKSDAEPNESMRCVRARPCHWDADGPCAVLSQRGSW